MLKHTVADVAWSMHRRDIDNHPVSTASTQACNSILTLGILSEEPPSFRKQILTFVVVAVMQGMRL